MGYYQQTSIFKILIAHLPIEYSQSGIPKLPERRARLFNQHLSELELKEVILKSFINLQHS